MKIKETTANAIMDSMAKAIIEAQSNEGISPLEMLLTVDKMQSTVSAQFEAFCASVNITEVIEGV